MDIVIGMTEKKQPIIVLAKPKITIGVNTTTKANVVYNFLEDDIPVSKLNDLKSMDAAPGTVDSIVQVIESIEKLEDEADSFSDIGLKDVDNYLMGAAEGDNAKRIETFMSLENRLLEARNALNIICHRNFDPKLTEMGIIEEAELRPEEEGGKCANC